MFYVQNYIFFCIYKNDEDKIYINESKGTQMTRITRILADFYIISENPCHPHHPRSLYPLRFTEEFLLLRFCSL